MVHVSRAREEKCVTRASRIALQRISAFFQLRGLSLLKLEINYRKAITFCAPPLTPSRPKPLEYLRAY